MLGGKKRLIRGWGAGEKRNSLVQPDTICLQRAKIRQKTIFSTKFSDFSLILLSHPLPPKNTQKTLEFADTDAGRGRDTVTTKSRPAGPRSGPGLDKNPGEEVFVVQKETGTSHTSSPRAPGSPWRGLLLCPPRGAEGRSRGEAGGEGKNKLSASKRQVGGRLKAAAFSLPAPFPGPESAWGQRERRGERGRRLPGHPPPRGDSGTYHSRRRRRRRGAGTALVCKQGALLCSSKGP